MATLPWFWMTETALKAVFIFWLGAIVGSFLNVVIWRLPRRKPGQSLMNLLNVPGSHCPHCGRGLKAYDNVPLLSFLLLRARCRTCKNPIAWRYFWVELLNASLFLAIYLHFRTLPDTIAYSLFAAALVAGFFIDLELYIIPDEITDFALIVGLGRTAWGLATGEPGQKLLWGWLPWTVVGAVVCTGIFVCIQVLGTTLFKKDAMGDGDVKLARAVGSLLPLSQALVSFLLAIVIGTVWGITKLALYSMKSRGDEPGEAAGGDEDEIVEQPPAPLRETLWFGFVHATFVDVLVRIAAGLGVPAARRAMAGGLPAETEEDEFVAGPTHLPFVPSMVLGALAAIFAGDRLVRWYMVWAGLA